MSVDSAIPLNPTELHEFLLGGGEMSKVIGAKAWCGTPLGAIENWPQSLRTTVSLCLASTFPISLAWGPQRIQIYNDGYWPLCGAKHPHSMGQDFRECWASAWPAIGEAFESAEKGEARYLENQRKQRRGIKDARSATARKLAELTWTIWNEQRCYIER